MDNIVSFLQENVYVVAVVLYVLGIFLKNSQKISDWLIPFILLPVGIAFAIAILNDILNGIIQGVLATAVAVLVHNLIKQGTERQ